MSVLLAQAENGSPPATEPALCPLCKGSDARPLLELHDAVWGKQGRFGLVQCKGCSLAFLSPRPVREGMGFYYRGWYEAGRTGTLESFQHGAISGIRDRGRLARLLERRRLFHGERHLDVGCGTAAFLIRLVKRTGATGVGIDFEEGAVAGARRRAEAAGVPLELYSGTLERAPLPQGTLASVSMIHFLEHCYEPVRELSRAHALLRPGGVILVEVPSFESVARRVCGAWWLPYLAPLHLSHFSRSTLAAALEQAGFREVRFSHPYVFFQWTTALVLWWHETLGGRSRFARNPAVQLFTLLFALTLFLPIVFVDLLVTGLCTAARRGDHLCATAIRPTTRAEESFKPGLIAAPSEDSRPTNANDSMR